MSICFFTITRPDDDDIDDKNEPISGREIGQLLFKKKSDWDIQHSLSLCKSPWPRDILSPAGVRGSVTEEYWGQEGFLWAPFLHLQGLLLMLLLLSPLALAQNCRAAEMRLHCIAFTGLLAMQAIRKSHGNEVDHVSPFDDIWAGFLLKKEICLYIPKFNCDTPSLPVLILYGVWSDLFQILFFLYFLVSINLYPQISMGFSQAMWHWHVNKVFSLLYLLTLCHVWG